MALHLGSYGRTAWLGQLGLGAYSARPRGSHVIFLYSPSRSPHMSSPLRALTTALMDGSMLWMKTLQTGLRRYVDVPTHKAGLGRKADEGGLRPLDHSHLWRGCPRCTCLCYRWMLGRAGL